MVHLQTTVYQMLFSGIPVECAFRFADTVRYFSKYIDNNKLDGHSPCYVSEQAFQDWECAGNKRNAFGEFCLLCQPVSEVLLDHRRCVFHSCALRYRDRAFLIAGGSGAGKSTHCRLLLDNHPDEFSVINGDKPILESTDKGVVVHPSPWNGKEGLHGASAAPLAAVFFLERDSSDSIEPCKNWEAAIYSFPMVFQSFETEPIIRKAAKQTERIIKSTPCFRFRSNDIDKSSALLYRTIMEVMDYDI